MTGEELLERIRTGSKLQFKDELLLIVKLATPSIIAQMSTIVMFYIDAAMVGSLGAQASAAVGLMSSSVWVLGGLCAAVAMGFAVQVAHLTGARDDAGARRVLRQSYAVALGTACILAAIAAFLSPMLPMWLSRNTDTVQSVFHDASAYFLIFALGLPFMQLNFLSGAMLRCSGDMKIPSMLNIMMCFLDVGFNFLFIFPAGTLSLPLGFTDLPLPGMNLGVQGAALGTAAAIVVTCVCMTYFSAIRSKHLSLLQDKGSFIPRAEVVKKAVSISLPMAGQHLAISLAQIVTTVIVAPLGITAIAAHSFAITVESLCYMPGNGLSEAATTLVGQGIGAKRRKLTVSFARITVALGMIVMAAGGVVMFFFSPALMLIMTPDQAVRDLTVNVLRIEAFAEPLFGAAIVTYGVFVGAGDTLKPSFMNFFSMWAVRLSLAVLLAPHYGLYGVWIAMAIELSFRGTIFLVRLYAGKWIEKHDFTRTESKEQSKQAAGTAEAAGAEDSTKQHLQA